VDESIEKLEQWSECSARSAISTEIANSRSNTTESEVHFESLHGVRWPRKQDPSGPKRVTFQHAVQAVGLPFNSMLQYQDFETLSS